MITKFNYEGKNLYTPIIFRPDFNDGATLSMTQAWSLFFTGGQEENALSDKPERAWFYTNLLIASVVTGIVGTLLFASF